QIDVLRAEIGPAESELVALEAAQADLERREAELTSALLAAESAHGRAAVDVQRARDRIDAIWERAAADDIDIEAAGDGSWELGVGGWEAENQASEVAATDTRTSETQSVVLGTQSVDASESLESKTQNALPETQSAALDTQSSESSESLESKIQNLKSKIQRLGIVNPLALEE